VYGYGAEKDLQDLQKMMMESNLSLKLLKENSLLSQIELKQSRWSFAPEIGVSLRNEIISKDSEDENNNFRSIYGELNLFNGFNDSERVDVSQKILNLNKDLNMKEELALVLRVESLFYQINFLSQSLKSLSSELLRTGSHIKLITKRVKARIITDTDLLEFQLYKQKLLAKQRYLILERKGLVLDLKSVVGTNENFTVKETRLPHYLLRSSLADIEEIKLNSRNIVAQKIREETSVGDVSLAKSKFYPKIDLRVERGYLDLDESFRDEEMASRVLLSFDFNLFSGNQHKLELEKKNIQLKLQGLKLDQLKFQNKVEINNYFNRLKHLEKMISLDEENQRIIKKLYRNTFSEYGKGVKDSAALQESSRKLHEQDIRIAELKADYVIHKLKLEQLVGQKLDFQVVKHK
jgi:outer membrane protein TolC